MVFSILRNFVERTTGAVIAIPYTFVKGELFEMRNVFLNLLALAFALVKNLSVAGTPALLGPGAGNRQNAAQEACGA